MFDKTFENLYAYAQQFAHEHKAPLEDVTEEVFRFHSSDVTKSQIFAHLNSMSWAESYQDNDKSNSNRPTFEQDIWLIVGETGQGKSSFVNYICSREVAPEGPGINSQTSEPKLYNAINSHLWLIDTPGLFDTRKDMKNDVVMTKIIQIVESKFEHNSHIDAIFLVWNPVMTMRLRLDEMIENLINSFGSSALKSLIIIVNKETTVWKKDKRYNDAVDELEKDNKKKGYNFPIITLDVKIKLTLADMRILKQYVNQITPYNEKDFSAYRKQCFYMIYREIKQRDQEEEEKERHIREAAEERVRQEEERIRQENERIRQEKERLREEKEKMRQEE
jgi:GTPase Era involved in 16S rRNA processing